MSPSELLIQRGFVSTPEPLFNSEQVNELRSYCHSYHGCYGENYPKEIFSVLNHAPLFDFVNTHLGPAIHWSGNYEFKSESNFHTYNLHHDAKGGLPVYQDYDLDHPPVQLSSNFRSSFDFHTFEYPVYRLFIYLDNLSNSSGGTKIKSYSHKKYIFDDIKTYPALTHLSHLDIPFVNNVNPPMRSGSALLFNARCYHSGFFLRYRPFPSYAFPTFVDNFFKRVSRIKPFRPLLNQFILPSPLCRRSIVIDFCYPSVYSLLYAADRYIVVTQQFIHLIPIKFPPSFLISSRFN